MNSKLLLLSPVLALALGCQQAEMQAPEVASTAAPVVSEVLATPEAPVADLLPNLRQPGVGIVSGGQPTAEQLALARDAGYKTVVNMRRPDERGVAGEAEIVSGLGMEYVSIPIDGAAGLTRENTEAFVQALETAEYPLVVHCGSGNRIGAMFALKAFWIDGKSADEALEIGRASGLTRLEGAVKEILQADADA